MEILFLIGRVIVGGYYIYSAANHFFQLETRSSYAKTKGVPLPGLAVFFTGILLLIGGLSILTGYLPVIGIICLVLFFLPVTFWMHDFWNIEDPGARRMQTINFMKNLALMGSSVMFLAIPQPWPLGLG